MSRLPVILVTAVAATVLAIPAGTPWWSWLFAGVTWGLVLVAVIEVSARWCVRREESRP